MTDTKPSTIPDARGSGRFGGTRGRRVIAITASLVAGAALVLAVAVFVLYVRGGGPAPEWASFLRPDAGAVLRPSSPAETVLRTLRLAGYQRAAVGDADGTVVVRVEVDDVTSSADVALTWQTAMAAASAAYPSAKVVVAQVFSTSQSLLEVSAPAVAVAAAVKADDPAALRGACTFRYLSEAGGE